MIAVYIYIYNDFRSWDQVKKANPHPHCMQLGNTYVMQWTTNDINYIFLHSGSGPME